MDESRIQTILDWPVPKNQKEVMSFLGFANFYRRFIESYAKVVHDLTDLQKRGGFAWHENHQKAFVDIKRCFQPGIILVHFDPSKSILVKTDASNFAYAAIML